MIKEIKNGIVKHALPMLLNLTILATQSNALETPKFEKTRHSDVYSAKLSEEQRKAIKDVYGEDIVELIFKCNGDKNKNDFIDEGDELLVKDVKNRQKSLKIDSNLSKIIGQKSPCVDENKEDKKDEVKLEFKEKREEETIKGKVRLYDCAQKKKTLDEALKDVGIEKFTGYIVGDNYIFVKEGVNLGITVKENEVIWNREGIGTYKSKSYAYNKDNLKHLVEHFSKEQGKDYDIYTIPTKGEIVFVPKNSIVSCAHGDNIARIIAPYEEKKKEETKKEEEKVEKIKEEVVEEKKIEEKEKRKEANLSDYLELKLHVGHENQRVKTDTLVPDETGNLVRTENNTSLENIITDGRTKVKLGRIFLLGNASLVDGDGNSGNDKIRKFVQTKYGGGIAVKLLDLKEGYLDIGGGIEGLSNEYRVKGELWNASRKDRGIGYSIFFEGNKLPLDSEFLLKYANLDGKKDVTTITDLSAFGRPNNIAHEEQNLRQSLLEFNGEAYLVDLGKPGKLGIVLGYSNIVQKEGENKINEEQFNVGAKYRRDVFGVEAGYKRRLFDSNDKQIVDKDGNTTYVLFEFNID